MQKRLPPLNTLWVFLAASRSLSFTKAADELFITRSAVSRQIKNLEDHIGFQLFERHKVGLELTDKGVEYANSISGIFADLKVATNKLHRKDTELKLRLGISATFNSTWLMQRLPKLDLAHPELAISFYTNSIDTGKESTNFSGETMDAAIRLGTGHWRGCLCDKLVDINVQLVCSPKLFEQQYDSSNTDQLANFNWLHYSHLPDLWANWISDSGADTLVSAKRDIVFDNVAVATQAAVDGLGIIPMYRPLADQLLKEKKLVIAHEHMMQKPESYYFVYPENHEKNDALTLFRNWLLENRS